MLLGFVVYWVEGCWVWIFWLIVVVVSYLWFLVFYLVFFRRKGMEWEDLRLVIWWSVICDCVFRCIYVDM